MILAPWKIFGPQTPSQTPAGIRRRYARSILVLIILLGIPLALAYNLGELPPRLDAVFAALARFAAENQWPAWLAPGLRFILPISLFLCFIHVMCGFLVWWEQKIAAHIQVRMGPMRVGGWHGWLQTAADSLKLLLKEDILPTGADRWVHSLAPLVVLAPAYVCYAPLALGDGLVAVDLDIGLLFILGVSGLSVIGLLMAGWGSNNKFSAMGGLRATAQAVSYGIPRVLAVLPVVMWAGSLSLSKIMGAQEGFWHGALPRWFIFYPVVGQISFLIYIICTVAETNRTPFDLAEAESELVAGYNTEYSGMKFGFFFLAEYTYVFLGCAVGAALFLGGGAPPAAFLAPLPSYVWFFAKTFFLAFLFMWFRWTFPRLRADRLMDFCWKFLLPWSLANILLAGGLYLWRG